MRSGDPFLADLNISQIRLRLRREQLTLLLDVMNENFAGLGYSPTAVRLLNQYGNTTLGGGEGTNVPVTTTFSTDNSKSPAVTSVPGVPVEGKKAAKLTEAADQLEKNVTELLGASSFLYYITRFYFSSDFRFFRLLQQIPFFSSVN